MEIHESRFVELEEGREPSLEELQKILELMGLSMTSVMVFLENHEEVVKTYASMSSEGIRTARACIKDAILALAHISTRVDRFGTKDDPLMRIYADTLPDDEKEEGGHA